MKTTLHNTLLGVISIFLMASCQEGKPPKTETPKPDPVDTTSSTLQVDTAAIINWNSLRKDESNLKPVLAMGNRFSFVKSDANTTRIHAYVGWSGGQVQFYLMDAAMDQSPNLTCSSMASLSTEMYTLPYEMDTTNEADSNAIKQQIASERIDNWLDTTKRNQWITQMGDTNVFQAFVIHADDIAYGQEHYGYFALKEFPEGSGTYQADLVLVNAQTGVVVSLIENKKNTLAQQAYSLQDMTAPIPPFKPSPYFPVEALEYTSFGILEFLEIH